MSPMVINEAACDGFYHFSLREITKMLLSIQKKAKKVNLLLLQSESTPMELGSLVVLNREQLAQLLSNLDSLLNLENCG